MTFVVSAIGGSLMGYYLGVFISFKNIVTRHENGNIPKELGTVSIIK